MATGGQFVVSPDKDQSHVAVGRCERREGTTIAIGPVRPYDPDRPLEKLVQASGSKQALGRFGFAAEFRDLRRDRLD